MKIGILTQPLATNYGGILQCYALMTTLKKLGVNPEVISRTYRSLSNDYYGMFFRFYHHMLYCIHHMCIIPMISKKDRNKIAENTNAFINKYIKPRTIQLYTDKALKKIINYQDYDGYIVGSDQCWRPRYSPNINNYFLDFTKGKECKRIAYAASFGVNNWEFSKSETNICSALAKQFNAISVREYSGVKLCKDYLGTEAIHVLDPTMLLEKEHYENLINNEKEPNSSGNLFCYILDQTKNKTDIIENISAHCKLTPFTVMPKNKLTAMNAQQNINDCIFPSVTKWLRAFMDAEMVITDSFHGCVFSIIFNKPFWVIANKQRGLARFESLLSLFDLESRIVSDDQNNHLNWSEDIDWNSVNNKRKKLQNKSLDFLKSNLFNG